MFPIDPVCQFLALNIALENQPCYECIVNTYATIAGVRFAFVHWPNNVLHDIDPSYGLFQTGALQPELAQDVVVRGARVVVGSFNSGPNYQPDGHNLLAQNGYRPLFSQDTHCAAPLHDFPPCADFSDEAQGKPAAVDNIDHIGLAALCIVKTR